jgi:hypothetical protein
LQLAAGIVDIELNVCLSQPDHTSNQTPLKLNKFDTSERRNHMNRAVRIAGENHAPQVAL